MLVGKTTHYYLLTLERTRDSEPLQVGLRCMFEMRDGTERIMKIFEMMDNHWDFSKTVTIPDEIFCRADEDKFFIEWAKDYWDGKDGFFNLKKLEVLDF